MVHQELNQALKRSVMDNLWLGRYPKKGVMIDEHKMYEDTKKLFNDLGIDVDPKTDYEHHAGIPASDARDRKGGIL